MDYKENLEILLAKRSWKVLEDLLADIHFYANEVINIINIS